MAAPPSDAAPPSVVGTVNPDPTDAAAATEGRTGAAELGLAAWVAALVAAGPIAPPLVSWCCR